MYKLFQSNFFKQFSAHFFPFLLNTTGVCETRATQGARARAWASGFVRVGATPSLTRYLKANCPESIVIIEFQECILHPGAELAKEPILAAEIGSNSGHHRAPSDTTPKTPARANISKQFRHKNCEKPSKMTRQTTISRPGGPPRCLLHEVSHTPEAPEPWQGPTKGVPWPPPCGNSTGFSTNLSPTDAKLRINGRNPVWLGEYPLHFHEFFAGTAPDSAG